MAHKVNDAAFELAVSDPDILLQPRQELIKAAQRKVHEGYAFVGVKAILSILPTQMNHLHHRNAPRSTKLLEIRKLLSFKRMLRISKIN